MNRKTQYGIDYQGRELGITFDSREDVDTYIAVAVETRGTDAAAYEVKHRTITVGDWAPTTPAPITVEAKRALRVVQDDAPARCSLHPAFEADYCPSCGTARVIGGVR